MQESVLWWLSLEGEGREEGGGGANVGSLTAPSACYRFF